MKKENAEVFKPDPKKNAEENRKGFLDQLGRTIKRRRVILSQDQIDLIKVGREANYSDSHIAKNLGLQFKTVAAVGK